MDNSATSSKSVLLADLQGTKATTNWCEQLLAGLAQSELEDLAAYARFRLNRIGLHPGVAEDVRQSAFLAVLLGSRSNLRGRHPREADLTDRTSFTRYLKGIICSLVEARGRSRENRLIFISLDLEYLGAGGAGTGERAAVEDLARQLFDRLRQRVPEHLRPTLRHWAAHWQECDTIPLAGKHRRHRQELRALAAKVLAEVNGFEIPI
jgi:hypothetical protein